MIAQLKGQHTIILSTHILPEVQASCDKVIIINRGHIVAEDTLDGLAKRMSGGIRLNLKVRRGADALAKELACVAGVRGVQPRGLHLEVDIAGDEDTVETVARMAVEKAGLLELKSESLSLEDIFIQLTSTDVTQ